MIDLEVDNFGRWPLSSPVNYLNYGKVSYPPSAVLPGQRETMIMHKTGWSTSGCYGTVSWELQTGKRAIVMWSAPLNFAFHSNILAVGIFDGGSHTKDTADLMYYKSGTFARSKYSSVVNAIEYCDNDFCIQGTMGTSHKPKVKISIYPKDTANLATNIQKYIRENEIDTTVG